tara:strand:+ start:145 stop:1971 length:1827 start_codon:yes stop_codon:yes gene_type:complete
MITTSIDSNGRIIVSDDAVTDDTPQEFTVCVKNESDWIEIHNYIINDNNIDDIPNRKISCTSEMNFSPKRSVYSMSVNEANILKNHSKVEWVEQSTMYNPIVLEQRKYDEEFDKHTTINRFKIDCTNRRTSGNPGSTLNFTQWGLYRHTSTTNNFGSSTTIDADSQYSLTGKNVDVVIMDTGVRWDHPEFWKPGVTSFTDKNDTRVRDILIHGAEEYSINWASEGLVAPGSGSLANYTEANVLSSSTFGGSWHGSHVAGTAAGNQFGAAFEANIWTIACVDRSDVGWSEPSDGFDYIKVWHKNKPVNPETGLKNPTVVNCSWGHRQFIRYDLNFNATFRGTTYSRAQVIASANAVPAVYYLTTNSVFFQFTTKRTSGQTEADELVNDSDCQNVVLVCAAGNASGKQEIKNGTDYNNQFTSGTFFYSSGYDPYYNRSGTPAITREGEDDAVIKVASIDSSRQSGSQERTSSFSDRGPNIDVWAAGSTVLSPYDAGFDDPRNTSFHNQYLNGTSMATPNVTGVIALHLESAPTSTRKSVREWLLSTGSVELSSSNYYDPYTSNSATDTNYWGNYYSLKSSPRRILYNPYANNTVPQISDIILSNLSVTLT